MQESKTIATFAVEAEIDLNDLTYRSMKELTREALRETGNVVLSPVAIYMTLVMLAKITDGNTKQEILNMLDVKECELEMLYATINGLSTSDSEITKCKILSSIWLNENMDYNEEMLNKLRKEYNLFSFAGLMGSEEMNQKIQDWLNETTGNMLKRNDGVKTSKNMLLNFLTTIHFCSKWDDEFQDEKTRPGSFYLENGKEVRCKFMNQVTETQYHQGSQFTAITKSFGANYDGIFILPNDGIEVSELLKDEQLFEILTCGELSSSRKCLVQLSMPKYDVSSKLNLKKLMKNLGIKDVFEADVADFTPISRAEEVFLSQVEQMTRFMVNEEGAQAASCINMVICAAGKDEQKLERVRFELNRPFLFAVISNKEVPIFVGKVDNL